MNKICLPHWWPHRFIWQRKITDELCHTHKNEFMLLFHDLHCWFIKCPYRKWK